MEDPLDAFQLLLIAGGDAVEGFIIVLQSTAALTAGQTRVQRLLDSYDFHEEQLSVTHMSTGSATSMYLIFISLGKSISSFTSQSLLTSTEESLGFSWALKHMDMEREVVERERERGEGCREREGEREIERGEQELCGKNKC